MDRGAWQTIVYGVAQLDTTERLSIAIKQEWPTIHSACLYKHNKTWCLNCISITKIPGWDWFITGYTSRNSRGASRGGRGEKGCWRWGGEAGRKAGRTEGEGNQLTEMKDLAVIELK